MSSIWLLWTILTIGEDDVKQSDCSKCETSHQEGDTAVYIANRNNKDIDMDALADEIIEPSQEK